MEINSSNYINSRVCFKLHENRLLHHIAIFAKNLNLIEYNYEIHDK